MTVLTREGLKKILLEGTYLVRDASRGAIDIGDFIDRYADFYHYNALDGHEEDEAGKKMLREFADVVSLHRQVQEDIVDVLYTDESSRMEEFRAAGRIDVEEALHRLRKAAEKHDLDRLLRDLEAVAS